MKPRIGERRALSHVGGPTTVDGNPELAAALAAAIDVPPSIESEELARVHVHGFHSYPARMHPLTAHRLVDALGGEHVLDPFCGSGTVLVEAALLGRATVGVDANPIAVRLAQLKTRRTTASQRANLLASAERVAEIADARRKAKAGASQRYPHEDVELFAPHVLLELDGLRVGIDGLADRGVARDLEMVLSSMLSKLARRGSDASSPNDRAPERRHFSGFATKHFVAKTRELTERLAEVEVGLASAPPVKVLEGDARALPGPSSTIDLVVTSPPYPGNYDYLAHHATRLRWLRLRAADFDEREIGARRRLDRLAPEQAIDAWRGELGAVLKELERVGAPDVRIVLLLADSVVADEPLYALDVVDDLAARVGLVRVAAASQERPHFHARTQRAFELRPRAEHAILLVKAEPARRRR